MRDSLISAVWLLGWSLIAWALLGAVFRHNRVARVLWGVPPVLIWWVLGAPITANIAVGHLEALATREGDACAAPSTGATFVVLAGGVRVPTWSSLDVTGLSGDSLRRLIAGEALASATPDSRMILSGGSGGRWKEADLMRELAIRLGYPASSIEIDRVSRTTYQSALNLKPRLAALPAGSIYLVTSAYHMPRAYMAFPCSGISVCALPVDFEAAHVFSWTSWFPTTYAFDMMTQALHEYVGLPYYAWKLRRAGSS